MIKPLFLPLLALGASLASGAELYNADFSIDGQGSTHDLDNDPFEVSPIMGANWQIFWDADPSTDTTLNSFITAGGKLVSNDWGGVAFFETDAVGVSALDSLVVTATGITLDNPFSNDSEYFEWFYSLDGGAPVSIQRFGRDYEGALDVTEVIDVSGADSLVVSFSFKIDGANDGFEIATVRVGDEVPSGLSVSLNLTSAEEDAVNPASAGTVTRAGDTAAAISVNLVSSDISELTVPAMVTIPAGQASATFDLTVVDDADLDGDVEVAITASGPALVSGSATFTVIDNELPAPAISISLDPATISENGGSSIATVILSEASGSDLTLTVVIEDTTEASAPATITLGSGETSGTFTVTSLDDDLQDGNQTFTLRLTDDSGAYEEGSANLTVTDDEDFVPPAILISEVRINAQSDPGNGEYFELSSAVGNVSLDRLSLVVIGDAGPAQGLFSGVVEEVVSLDGLMMNGNYFVVAETAQEIAMNPDLERSLIFENSDNVTFLLVSDFTGAEGEDLDTDDDGELDVQPWGSIVDGVSFIIVPNPADGSAPSGDVVEWDYSGFLMIQGVGPDGAFAPSHIFRDAMNGGGFSIGTYDQNDANAKDSPGAENPGGAVIPMVLDPKVISLTFDKDTGAGEMVVTGLGSSSFNIEIASDLTASTPWVVLGSGFTELDNPDGTVTFSFTDNSIPNQAKRFYRIIETP